MVLAVCGSIEPNVYFGIGFSGVKNQKALEPQRFFEVSYSKEWSILCLN